ncbi:hypothetical protein ACFT8Q_00705 [Streptomyces griseoincarnatus]
MAQTLLKQLDQALHTLARNREAPSALSGPRCADEDALKAMLAAAE